MLDDYAMRIDQGQLWVADWGGAVAGMLVLIPQADAMLLDNVAVAPNAQGLGLGRQMLSWAEKIARKAGYGVIRLYANEAMVENIALYTRIGYVETHRVEEQGWRRVHMRKGSTRLATICEPYEVGVEKILPPGDRPRMAREYQIMAADFLQRLISKRPSAAAWRGLERPSLTAPDEWGALMVAAQNGHGGAYRRLLSDITEWLNRYFQRRLPAGEVDDAVQETLLAVHRRRHTYDPQYPLGPWLAAIAKHKWVDQLRSLGRRSTDELPDDLSVGDHETSIVSSSVLASLLEELRPAQAQAILLVKVQGYSIEEASAETGLSPSAIKMNIHRGLARLSAFIEKTSDVE